jgi:hypothetical protein
MSRVAIIGSCITRDLWPILGVEADEVLYVSRTSLASLFSRPWSGVEVLADPPAGLNRGPHNAVVADLKKTALSALIAHRPEHIIFDFIDERFDLLALEGQVVTHSWELGVSGYLEQASLTEAHRVERLSNACDMIWTQGLAEMADLLQLTPLRDAQVILHEAQWAADYVDADGKVVPFDDSWEQMPGTKVSRAAHNELLARYQQRFAQALPKAQRVAASGLRRGDVNHRWGLSPFHYVDAYYGQIWTQLQGLGVG